MTAEAWKFEQIAPGVSRVPIDIDQDRALDEERRKERQANPLVIVMPTKDGWLVEPVEGE